MNIENPPQAIKIRISPNLTYDTIQTPIDGSWIFNWFRCGLLMVPRVAFSAARFQWFFKFQLMPLSLSLSLFSVFFCKILKWRDRKQWNITSLFRPQKAIKYWKQGKTKLRLRFRDQQCKFMRIVDVTKTPKKTKANTSENNYLTPRWLKREQKQRIRQDDTLRITFWDLSRIHALTQFSRNGVETRTKRLWNDLKTSI